MEENKSPYTNDNVYATVHPTETGTDNGYTGATGYNGAPGAGGAAGFNGAPGAGGAAGFNGAPGYNGAPGAGYGNTGYNSVYLQKAAYNANAGVRCPGKEITSMVLGIVSLFYGAFGVVFCWHPVLAWTFGILGVGCGIPAIILHNQVMKIATITTKKVKIGKNLGTAGIICGAVTMVLDIIIVLVAFLAIGTSLMSELY